MQETYNVVNGNNVNSANTLLLELIVVFNISRNLR